ncbi:DUF5958 family protein [Streptomyces sp. NPDC001276]|uniref:DUF5958 family protein n=1 Tax=Streptomyces sp. NPDC001276 TaxID=3364555 RepID=UPI00368D1FB0
MWAGRRRCCPQSTAGAPGRAAPCGTFRRAGVRLQILGLADARRRERFCADRCRHEWHQLARGEEPGLPVT